MLSGHRGHTRTDLPPPAVLSRRELQVLALVADGHTNAEIGARLDLGEDTIKTHVRRITKKMHAKNRAHAVLLAFRQGWLT